MIIQNRVLQSFVDDNLETSLLFGALIDLCVETKGKAATIELIRSQINSFRVSASSKFGLAKHEQEELTLLLEHKLQEILKDRKLTN